MAKKQITSVKRQLQDTPKKPSQKVKGTEKTKSLQQNINTIAQNNDVYTKCINSIIELLEEARHLSAKSVNAILTAAYWDMGRQIVELEQNGQHRADYGEEVIESLSIDLTAKFGRGFGRSNLFQMRAFYCAYPQIVQTVSGQFTN